MAIPHAAAGEIIDVRPLAAKLAESATHVLVKTDYVEIVRLVLPAGKTIPEHKAPAAILVQCLEGRVAFTALEKTVELSAGEMIHLPPAAPHAVRAVEASSVLLTVLSK